MAQNKVKSTSKVVDTKQEPKLNKRDDDSDEYSSCDDSNTKEAIPTKEALEERPDDPCHTNRFQRRQRGHRSRSRRSKSRQRSRSKRNRRRN